MNQQEPLTTDEQTLLDYIRAQYLRGIPLDSIRVHVLQAGWPAEMVTKVLLHVSIPSPVAQTTQPAVNKPKPKTEVRIEVQDKEIAKENTATQTEKAIEQPKPEPARERVEGTAKGQMPSSPQQRDWKMLLQLPADKPLPAQILLILSGISMLVSVVLALGIVLLDTFAIRDSVASVLSMSGSANLTIAGVLLVTVALLTYLAERIHAGKYWALVGLSSVLLTTLFAQAWQWFTRTEFEQFVSNASVFDTFSVHIIAGPLVIWLWLWHRRYFS